ncbi:hypothetical protein cyc_03516 [Cyclospora cayetanensis]|uniref:Uncharacterized protein n=1 Tax=Cyclospora cayetanensis TaxID=88456 RepID=A0A1D3CRT7_9EIME|nr:hypothetical protein cyc_03516 [Cyclospora cayetanensis]
MNLEGESPFFWSLERAFQIREACVSPRSQTAQVYEGGGRLGGSFFLSLLFSFSSQHCYLITSLPPPKAWDEKGPAILCPSTPPETSGE